MMPATNYLGSLTKVALSKSAQSGSMQFVAVFTLTHQADAGEWQPLDAVSRNVYLSMNGKAKDYTIKKLKSLGIGVDGPPETVTDGDEELVVLPQAISDQSIELKCEHQTWQGQARERWDIANWGGGGTGEAASKEDAAKLKAMWS